MNIQIPFLSTPPKKNTKEADRIMCKYSDRIPVIVNRHKNSTNTPEIDKNKYLVPADLTMGQFLYVIRKRLQMSPEKALFMFVDGSVICNTDLVCKVYADSHDPGDRFLYVTYSSENTFGSPEMKLRNYKTDTPQYYFYREQHRTQTYEYVCEKLRQYQALGNVKIEMSMNRALELMDSFVDPSDPDTHSENSVHAYQTAERIRKQYPDNKELQVCGLIHDLGKVLFVFGEPSFAVVGDTYAVGCKFPESIVYYDTMVENPDFNSPVFSTECGIYNPNCGIENLKLSFGHDEYLYQVLQHNGGHKISRKCQNMIRFHSFYPWHTGKAYTHLMKPGDEIIMQDVLHFNQFDLYSKEDTDFVLTDEIRAYYENLLADFFPNSLQW